MFIQDVVERMVSEGFKLTPRTLTFYVEQGLLPQPEKRGGYKKGVRLAFREEDAARAIRTLYLIFSLKGKGYKLAEIKDEIDRLYQDEKALNMKSKLDRYVEINDRVYYEKGLRSEHGLPSYTRLDEVLGDEGPYRPDLSECGSLDMILEASRRVQALGLCHPLYVCKGVLIYDEGEGYAPGSWVILNLRYMINWDVLLQLFKVSVENLKKYFYWPNPSGKTCSHLSIRWMQQESENEVGLMLQHYIEWMEEGFPLGELYPNFGLVNYSFRYSSRAEFIEEFIAGKCAFVPIYPDEDGKRGVLFLKRFIE
ncbi:MAG: MerR family transcriptional regulator [Nitrospina sp.]|jgi:DNA-binding transcriptional MerR regulator|nr:MerR family transcriptional regulator [Nitrospina sp.]